MKISATIQSEFMKHNAFVETNKNVQEIQISPKQSGWGSAINGGELLLLSIATCFCNDIYREASVRNIVIRSLSVEVNGEFGAEGELGTNFKYKTNIISDATAEEIEDLINFTDNIAEVHNTLRQGIKILLVK